MIQENKRIFWYRITILIGIAIIVLLYFLSPHTTTRKDLHSIKHIVSYGTRYVDSNLVAALPMSTEKTTATYNYANFNNLNSNAASVVARVAYNSGFRGNDLVEMVAIAYAESRWGANPYSPGSSYVGLWQMSYEDEQQMGVQGDLLDYQTNGNAAYSWWLHAAGTDPSGTALPAPDLTKVTPVDTEYGQGYLAGTKFSPWTDFGYPAVSFYRVALAFTNENIQFWGLPSNWSN